MNLIPPSTQCPQDRCHEVVQVCWADGGGNVAGCAVVPAGAFTGRLEISFEDTLLITGALWGAIAVAFVYRLIGKSMMMR